MCTDGKFENTWTRTYKPRAVEMYRIRLYLYTQWMIKRTSLFIVSKKPDHCELCDYWCRTPGNLRSHMRTHLRIEIPKDPFQCAYYNCRKSGTFKSSYAVACSDGKLCKERDYAHYPANNPEVYRSNAKTLVFKLFEVFFFKRCKV